MEQIFATRLLRQLCGGEPLAAARVKGSPAYPAIRGRVSFYQTGQGVIVLAEVTGLPTTSDAGPGCDYPVFAMHIHEGGSCTGNAQDPFADTKGHYNPANCQHPAHAGDLPPLFSNGGTAWYAVLTDRFTVNSVIGRTVIIHRHPDDFTTQPSGNSGEKIACGVIRPGGTAL
jgi:Cu-Zn family superoxide dismutase